MPRPVPRWAGRRARVAILITVPVLGHLGRALGFARRANLQDPRPDTRTAGSPVIMLPARRA